MTERKSFLLRLNPRLHQVLERWAADDLRSLNAQIEYLLVEAAKKTGRWASPATEVGEVSAEGGRGGKRRGPPASPPTEVGGVSAEGGRGGKRRGPSAPTAQK